MMRIKHTWNRAPAISALVIAGVLGLTGSACGVDPAEQRDLEQLRAVQAMFDIPGLAFTGTCVLNNTTGAATLTLLAGDKVIVGVSSGNGNITINGNTTNCQNANYANVKSLAIVGPASSAERLVLDYTNGTFAQSTGAGVTTGTTVDLGGDGGVYHDLLYIRAQNSNTLNQNITVGAHGIFMTASNFNDILLVGGHNPNWLTLALGAGNDTVSAAGTTALGGASGQGLTVYGNDGADVFYTSGSNFNDLYSGGNGNDTIYVSATVSMGHQTYDGVAGLDTVDFSARTAGVQLYNNNIYVSGDIAGNENCRIANANILVGGQGADILQGSPTVGYNQWLNGGPGNDNFVQGGTSTGDSNDVISGGTGIDTVNYRGRSANTNVTLDGNPNDGSSGEADNIGVDVENVYTGSGADLVVGSASANVLDAGAGTNVIQGLGGSDTFLQFVSGADTIACGTGSDTIDYTPRGAGDPAITAVLDGTTHSGASAGGENDILGTDCEDLNGAGSGAGNQILTGNDGDNLISAGGTTGSVTIDCLGGSDTAIGDASASNAPGSQSNCELFVQ